MQNTEKKGGAVALKSTVDPLTFAGRPLTYGMRFSALDAGTISLALLITITGWQFLGVLIAIVPFVVGHFFLFCNVFRIRRTPELIWAVSFVLLYAAFTFVLPKQMVWAYLVQMGITATILAVEIRSPRYHGIFARVINPHLNDYLQGKLDE